MVNLIKNANRIVIASHINPDGDTIGSMLGLGIALKKINKKISFFNVSKELPAKFDFLPNYSKIRNTLPKSFDLLIAVDCADFGRIGIKKGDFDIINLDHHKTNTLFGDINVVKENYVSTSMVVYELLEKEKFDISPECATCLYTALVDDSGFFQYERVDKYSFEIAEKLVGFGAKPYKISNYINNRNSLAKLRLLEIYLERLELKNMAKIAVSKLWLKDFEKTGALLSDSDSLVHMGLSLSTVVLSIFAYQTEEKKFKISLRSKGNIDCSEIALIFGGGGHKKAAGFTISLDKIDDMLEAIYKKSFFNVV